MILRSHCKTKHLMVIVQPWNGSILIDNFPSHYKRNDDLLRQRFNDFLTNAIMKELQMLLPSIQCSGNSSQITYILKMSTLDSLSPTNIHSNESNVYMKTRLNDDFLCQFSTALHLLIPPTFILVTNNPPQVFYNTVGSICATHFDRDDSVLIVLKGWKHILLAKKDIIKAFYSNKYFFISESGMHPLILPFDETKKQRQQKGWVELFLQPGEALYIPKNVVHCIHSSTDTLAISFQVIPTICQKRSVCYSQLSLESNIVHDCMAFLERI